MPIFSRLRFRTTLLIALMGWVVASGVYASQAATGAAWREFFAQSLCVGSADHAAHAAHHAACAAHCAALGAGAGAAGAPPTPWVVASPAVRRAASVAVADRPVPATAQLLPPARAPPPVVA